MKREELKVKSMYTQKGITLIALVITIIVLLILAGVTINLTLGQNGIFKTAEQAARNYKEAENKELSELSDFEASIVAGKVAKEENGIQYVGDGRGKLIPVPKGFSYLEGTKDTGFVIKNDTDDNEFVWVPVDGMGYTYNRYAMLSRQPEDGMDITTKSMKIKHTSSYTNYYIEMLPTDESESVAKYGGYYIGRYEAGIEGGKVTSTSNSASSKEWTGWTTEADKEMKLVVKPGAKVWNYITRNKAIEVAKGLYNKVEDNVTSKLCSSYAWDTALKFIETKYPTYPTNSVQGNYSDKSATLAKLEETGKTQAVNNIYDMGGNVWEWTTESYSNANESCITRGGGYSTKVSDSPASYRSYNSELSAYHSTGLRVALFL